MIRDTSAQDTRIAATTSPSAHRRLLLVGGGVLAGVLLLGWALAGWMGSSRAVSIERLRFAEVTRGTLVRDAAVNGRVVAAVSPTLYAPAGGTVTLKIQAGDTVAKGTVMAVIDSPELANELQREQATLAQLEAEVSRQRILAQKASLLARRDAPAGSPSARGCAGARPRPPAAPASPARAAVRWRARANRSPPSRCPSPPCRRPGSSASRCRRPARTASG